jgi:cobalt-zinc-cadmium efflux system membrane fusion protein
MTSFTTGETKADTANLFTLPADQIAHLQIAPAVRGSLPRVLRFTGSVAYNALVTTPVFSAAGGPVREILVMPGDMVRAGQPLLNINSPDYSQARSAYLKAKDAFALADKNYKRAQDLFEHKAIAERDVQQAESDREQAQADVESSTDVLRALGVSDPETTVKASATLLVPLLAPVNG